MSGLPAGWSGPHSLGEVCDVRSGFWGAAVASPDASVPVNVVRNGDIDSSGRVVGAAARWFTHSESERSRVAPGDVLFTGSGDIGKSHLVSREDLWVSNFVKRLRPRRSVIEPSFLAHLVRHPGVSEVIDRHAGGSTIRNLRKSFFAEAWFCLPSLEEQRRIVDILEDHLSRLDAGVRLLDDAEKRLDSLVDALLLSAFGGRVSPPEAGRDTTPDFSSERCAAWTSSTSGKQLPTAAPVADGEQLTAPPGWLVASLEAVTSPVRVIRYGILKPRVKSGGTVPYVEVKDLAGNTLAGKSLHRTTTELDSQFSGARLAEGDVLIAVRGSFERTALVPAALESANISRDVARIAPLPSLSSAYLHLWLQSPSARRYLNAHARGVAVKGVNIHSLRSMPIVVPGRVHQDLIADVLTQELDAVTHIRSELAAQRLRAASLRRALLKAAFDGRLTGSTTTTVEVLEEPRV